MSWRVDLGNDYWYDSRPDYYKIDDEQIRTIEKSRNCRYVTEWYTLDSKGKIIDQPTMIFWNDEPHPQGSNWMGLFRDYHDGAWYVNDGITASRLPIQCMVSNDKQLVFSKTRHDFRTSRDGSVSVDGGRDYTRVVGAIRNERVWLIPQNGELKIIPETLALLMTEKNK